MVWCYPGTWLRVCLLTLVSCMCTVQVFSPDIAFTWKGIGSCIVFTFIQVMWFFITFMPSGFDWAGEVFSGLRSENLWHLDWFYFSVVTRRRLSLRAVSQRGISHLMAHLQYSCLLESLYFFIFFQSIHSLVLQSFSVMKADKWYTQKAYVHGLDLLFSTIPLDMFSCYACQPSASVVPIRCLCSSIFIEVRTCL